MYEDRRKKLLQTIREETNVDTIAIKSPLNIYYYTNVALQPHERFYMLFIDVSTAKTTLFVPALDETEAKQHADVDEVVPIADTDDPYEIVRNKTGNEIERFAVEKNVLTLEEVEAFQNIFGNVQWVDANVYMMAQRQVKTAAEIERVKQAIHVTEQGIEKTIVQVRVGMTELDVKRMLERELFALGAEKMAFDTIVLTGARSALPHGVSGNTPIEEGDFLLIDVGITINHYHSDMTRTFVVGEVNEKQQMIYETVKEANERAIEAVQVGERLQTIDLAARKHIEARGFGTYFTHRVGHGLGIDVHELPSLHAQNEERIERGLLFTIEPGIYVPDVGGVRIEDVVYVNDNENVEVFTSYPKELTIINGTGN